MGSLRKYAKTAALAGLGRMTDNPWLTGADYLLRFLRTLVLLALWRSILSQTGPAELSLEQMLTYTVMAAAFEDLFTARTTFEGAIWRGGIALNVLRPMGIFGQFSAESMGIWAVNFVFYSIPLLLISPLLGVSMWPASAAAGAAFAGSVALAATVGLGLEYLFGMLMVWLLGDAYVVQQVRSVAAVLLTGVLIPLAFFPWGLGRVLDWLPYAAMASAPLRIYTGAGPILPLLAMQACWALILWPCAFAAWRVTRERMVTHGG